MEQARADGPVRVVSALATDLHYIGQWTPGSPPGLAWDWLWRLYEPELLIGSLPAPRFEASDVTFAEAIANIKVDRVSFLLLRLPSDRVVCVVVLDLVAPSPLVTVAPLSAVLEALLNDQIRLRGEPLDAVLVSLLDEPEWRQEGWREPMVLDQHHLLFLPCAGDSHVNQASLAELTAHGIAPYQSLLLNFYQPSGLNEASSARQAWVSPNVSVVYGHEREVEDNAVYSAVELVSTAAHLRRTLVQARRQLLHFQERTRTEIGMQARNDLEGLADNMGNLEFEFAFATQFPLTRIPDYHASLADAMDVPSQPQALRSLFESVDRSLRAELVAIDVRERIAEEAQRSLMTVAGAILVGVGIAVAFVIGFLGINAVEVNPDYSMWDDHYAPIYLVAAIFGLAPLALLRLVTLWSWPWARDLRRTRLVGAARIVTGVVAVLAGYIVDRLSSVLVIGAILKGVGLVLLLLGLVTLAATAREGVRKRKALMAMRGDVDGDNHS